MGKRFGTFVYTLVATFILIGVVSYFTLGYSEISDTLWIRVYSPLINFLMDWQLVYQILFLIGIIFVVISDGLIIPLAFYHYFKTRKLSEKIKFWAPITILIPAYNEEVNLARTIESVYNAKYQGDKEIIVINDGSTDKTQEIAERYVERGMVELINRKNGGKTAAINTVWLRPAVKL